MTSDVKVTVRLTSDLAEEISEKALANGRTFSEEVRSRLSGNGPNIDADPVQLAIIDRLVSAGIYADRREFLALAVADAIRRVDE